jgi:hypothetical protein
MGEKVNTVEVEINDTCPAGGGYVAVYVAEWRIGMV